MREEFLMKIGVPDDYSYVSGRIKILESLLLGKETFEKLSEVPTSELKQILAETPYKGFIKGEENSDLLNAVFERFKAELAEMGKYASPGFINIFFKNKEIFLRLKKWALVQDTSETNELYLSLKKFIQSGSGKDFPIIFINTFNKMIEVRKNPLEVGIVLDIYRLKYLMNSANLTESDLIKSYYKIYSEVNLQNMLFRINHFVASSLIDNTNLSLALSLISENFSDFAFTLPLKNIKDVEQFENFVNENLKEINSEYIQSRLIKILDMGKFINVGIEVVFTYLKRLEFEVSTLSMILSGRGTGAESKEILEKVALAE